MPSIQFTNVTLRPHGASAAAPPILDEVSLHLEEPRIGVIGANGSGKSSLVRCINGLNLPDEGSVTVNGADVRADGASVRRQVGFLFSNADSQILMPTVSEDVAFSLRKEKLSRAEKHERVLEALRQFGLEDKHEQSPHTLSGGQKQLLALAAILVMRPDVLVADEPTTLLDLRNRNRIRRTLNGLQQQIIVVTHDLELVEDYERVIWIADGKVEADSADGTSVPDLLAEYRKAME